MSSLAVRGVSFIPLRVVATIGTEEKSVKTNSTRPADAEEICTLLEQAVLKYFPRPIENVDTFLFASGDDGAVGDLQAASPPRASTATALATVKRGLRFLCFV